MNGLYTCSMKWLEEVETLGKWMYFAPVDKVTRDEWLY